MVSDETFFAWLDGELDPAEATRVEAQVAADPRLTAIAAEHRALQSHLKGAFDLLLDAPVPESIIASVSNPPGAEIINLEKARTRSSVRYWFSAAQWGSMAATLVLGILLGTIIPRQHENAHVEVQSGKIYAAGSLGHALDTELASAPQGDIRIGMTFHDHAGAICRNFTDAASSGLACRDQERWQLRGIFAAPETQPTDYRMASGMNPALAALVDSTMSGEPFDAAQEQAARQRHWK